MVRVLRWVTAFVMMLVSGAINGRALAEDDAELVKVVVELLSDKDKDIRALGLEQVRTEAKGEAATKLFAAELPKLSADAQVGLLAALADRGDRAARQGVLELFKASKDNSVRVAAISAIGSLGAADDVSMLVGLIADGSKPEQSAARKSLTKITVDGAGKLIATELGKAEPALSVTLMQVLVDRREKTAVPELLAEALDDDATIRTAAMAALGELASAEHVGGMVTGVLAAKAGAERTAAEKALMFVCERIMDADKRADPLLAVIDGLKPEEQMTMLSTLGRVGGPAALKRIEAVVASKDTKTRDVGMKALCNWPDASIATRFIELATSAESPDHRTMALRALIRVAPLADKRTDKDRLDLLATAMKMCQRDDERKLVLQRARAVRTVETLRYLVPFMEQTALAQVACESIVELAHHRALRDANKAEFHQALDKVIATSKDAVVVDRAGRYKRGETWVRPK